MTQPESTVPTVGASGAIAGVLGAYLTVVSDGAAGGVVSRLISAVFLQLHAVLYLGAWFVIQLFSGTLALASPAAGRRHRMVGARWGVYGGTAAMPVVCAAPRAVL